MFTILVGMKENGEDKRILVVDDEPDVTELLTFNLRKHGYVVEAINSPLLIMGKAREFRPDLFILDVMMPDLNGTQICRMLRADPGFKQIPIVFLTARGETDDRIAGLESGGDDYIAKPFDIRELLLRIQGLLKRAGQNVQSGPRQIKVGRIMIDEEVHQLTIDGNKVDLTVTEFKLLKILMERKGRVQTRENLLVNVWNYDADIETRTVDTHIRRLREKLGSEADMIETIRGVGYRMVSK